MKISKILFENIFTFKIFTGTLNNPSLYLLEKFFFSKLAKNQQ